MVQMIISSNGHKNNSNEQKNSSNEHKNSLKKIVQMK